MTKYNCCIAQLRNVPGANSIKQCVEEPCVEVLDRAHKQQVLRKQQEPDTYCTNPGQITQVHAWLQKMENFSLQGADQQQQVQAALGEVSPDFDSLKKKKNLQLGQSPPGKSFPGMGWRPHNWIGQGDNLIPFPQKVGPGDLWSSFPNWAGSTCAESFLRKHVGL